MVVGDGRKYLTALIWPSEDAAALGDAALARGLQSWIAAINADLARPVQVKDFRVPPRALSLAKGELTLKGTIRRASILTSFKEVIDDMYDAVEQDEFARHVRLPDSPAN